NIYQYGDGKGDLIETIFPDNTHEQFQYEPVFHHLVVFQDALGRLTTYTYDEVSTGALLTVEDALHHVTTNTWETDYLSPQYGLLKAVTDPLGHTTSYLYDDHRHLIATVDALSNHTTYGYDGANNRTTVTDPLGRTTTTAYDGMRRVQTVTNPMGGVEQ